MDARRKFAPYGVAVLATGLALALRLPLNSVLGSSVSYVTFFPAVLFSAWRGGWGPGLLCTASSGLAALYFVIEPVRTFRIASASEALGLALFTTVSLFLSWMAQRMRDAEAAERSSRLLSEQTLASIADAVIAVDTNRSITFVNPAAADLTGWHSDTACGRRVEEVFRIVSEKTGEPELDPIGFVLTAGSPHRIANHTEVVAKDGRRTPIEHSAAPIRDMHGEMIGAVLVFRDVTARRTSENALVESRERLSATLESITDAFMALDSEWRFTYVNAAAERSLRTTRDALIGRNHWEMYPDMLGTALEEEYVRVMRSRDATAFDFYSKRSDRWLEVNAYPSLDGGIAIYFRDITPRKEAEAALARSRAETERARDLLQTTLASIGDGVIVTDVEGRITFLNTVAATLMGVAQHDAVGKPLEHIFVVLNENTRKPVESPAARAIRDGVTVGLASQTTLVAQDGRETPIDDSAAPIRNADGSIIGAVLVFRDVTAKRGAEIALQQSEERLRLALRVGEIGVWDWDITANRITWSERVYVMHGVQPGEFGGRVEDLTPLIHSEDRPQVERAIQDALEHGSHYQVLLRAVHPDGQVRWLETTGQVIRNEEGRPVRMLGATTDATDRVRAEAEMRQQAKQLQISNADLERFAFAASHDLQEPLRMVTIYSQLLRRRIQDSLDDDSRQFIEIILDSTTRMRRLIEDLLEYSQVTHEQRTVTRVDASAVMKQVLLNCEIAIKESGATIDCAPLPTVQVRQSQLVQVFQNLVINAIRYRSPAPPHIQISAERRTREWVFSVRDNGIGIPPQQQTRVFELFKRLDSKSPGTGIGLALCQRIIDGHGGRIWVESEVGQGSTFYFTLPDPADIPAAVTPQRAAQPLGG